MMNEEYQGPLEGLRVLDFGHYYAGPMVGMLLADQGATVIRVAKPGDAELPEEQYRLLNRNKQLLALDLKSEEGKAQALALIERADVLIENFRPGVMKRLGLDYANVKEANPGLIYLSLPGFASTDTDRKDIQAWEGIISATSGLYTETQVNRQALNFPPLYTLVPLRSMHGGIFGANAVLAGLLSREKHGCGTLIETPLHEVAMFNLSFFMMSKRPSGAFRAVADPNAQLPEHLKPFVYEPGDSEEVQLQKLEGARDVTAPYHPCYGQYPCADGRQVFINTFMYPHITEKLFRTLDIYKQVLSEGFVLASGWDAGIQNNACNMFISGHHKSRLKTLIAEAMKTRTAEEWETALTSAGVLAAKIRSRDEWLTLEPMIKSHVLAKLGQGGAALTVPARVGSVSYEEEAAPGEHYDLPKLINAEKADTFFGNRASQQGRAKEHKSVPKSKLLEGLKVADMSNVAAGPICGYLLAEYGADVVMAQHPLSYPDAIIASGNIIGPRASAAFSRTLKQLQAGIF